MSNATQAQLHYNIVIEHTHKLWKHMYFCQLCNPVEACPEHLYLVDELHAAQKVYQETCNKWKKNEDLYIKMTPAERINAVYGAYQRGELSNESTESEIPECPHGCQE